MQSYTPRGRDGLLTLTTGLVVPVLLLITALGALFVLRPATPRAHAAMGVSVTGLHVQGSHLANGAGQPVALHGVTRAGTEYMCVHGGAIFDGPSDAASLQVIASWHVNAIRVPLNEDCWLGINGVSTSSGGAAYQQAIVNYVNLITSQGMAVSLDLHWNAPGGQLATSQQKMPDRDHSVTFWSEVANTFKGNSAVIYELYNEPHDVDWVCWKNGGSCAGASYPVAGMQELVNAVRATGATNVVALGGLAWSNDLTQWLAYRPADPLNEEVAAWHVYNFNACNNAACYDNTAGQVAQTTPVIATEIGETDCQSSFVTALMNWLDSHGQSYVSWTWNTWGGCGGPTLVSDFQGTPNGAYGQGVKAHLLGFAGPVAGTGPSAPVATSTVGTTVSGNPAPPAPVGLPTATAPGGDPASPPSAPISPPADPAPPVSVPPDRGGNQSLPMTFTFSFEDGTTDGWTAYGTQITSVENSTDQAMDGVHSLRVSLTGVTAATYPYLAASTQAPAQPGQALSLYVYVPQGVGTLWVRPFTMNDAYRWVGGENYTALTPGWNHVTHALPRQFTGQVIQVGLQFMAAPGTTANGSVYIDAVGWQFEQDN
jgi:hypothetical protein